MLELPEQRVHAGLVRQACGRIGQCRLFAEFGIDFRVVVEVLKEIESGAGPLMEGPGMELCLAKHRATTLKGH
jgi:hypothetical protein